MSKLIMSSKEGEEGLGTRLHTSTTEYDTGYVLRGFTARKKIMQFFSEHLSAMKPTVY